jgi:tetratricopeptide (TPR) repeat protein
MKKLYLLPLCIVFSLQINFGQENKNEIAKALANKADTLFRYYKYDSAAVYYCKTAGWYEQKQNWLLGVKNYRLTSNALIKAAKYDTAYYFSRKALDLANKYFQESNKEEMFEKPDVFINMADVNEKKGKYKEELESCEKALELVLIAVNLNKLRIAHILNKIGVAYYHLMQYDSALQFCDSAISIRKKFLPETHIDIAESNSNIGKIYYCKGEYDIALEYFQKALTIRIAALGEQNPDFAGSYSNIGTVYWEKGDYDKALEYFQKALTISIVALGKQHPDVAYSYNNIGEIYSKKSKPINALDYYQKALMANIVGFSDTSVYINPNLGKILSEPVLLRTLAGKANTFYQLYKNNTKSGCDLEASLSAYELAFQLVHNMRNRYNIEDTKLSLSEETKSYYAHAAHVAMEYNKIYPSQENAGKVFGFLELGKSATLAARFNEYQAKHFAGIPDTLLETEKALRIRIGFFNTQIEKERYQKNGCDSLKVNILENEKFTCSRKLDSLITYFETAYPAYYELKYAEKTATVTEIQKTLDHHTAPT